MANLLKRRNFNRPFEEHEVDANWDEIDRRTKVDDPSFDTMNKIAEYVQNIPDPVYNEDYVIISNVTFTSGERIEFQDGKIVIGYATPENPLSYKYNGNTFVLSTAIELLTTIDTDTKKRLDAIVLTPSGTVELLEGEEVPADSSQRISPVIPGHYYLYGYVMWDSASGSTLPPTLLKTSELINDGDGRAPFITALDLESDLFYKNANFPLLPEHDNRVVITNGKTCTVTPTAFLKDLQTAMKNADDDNTDIVFQAAPGWTISINGEAAVSNATVSFSAGGTCAIVVDATRKKIYCDGDVE